MLAALAVLVAATPAFWLAGAHVRRGRYRARHGVPDDVPLASFVREWASVYVVGWWTLRARFSDGYRSPPNPTGRPVLCIHGLWADGTTMWGIRRSLEAAGRPTGALWLGFSGRRVAGYAPRVQAAMHALLARSDDGIDIVAHSMGGVVVRFVLAQDEVLARGVRRVVTLGSPHQGTASLRGFLPVAEIADLSQDSAFVRGLPALSPGQWTTVSALDDVIVYPVGTVHLPGARQVDVPAIGHVGLVVHKEAHAAIIDALR